MMTMSKKAAPLKHLLAAALLAVAAVAQAGEVKPFTADYQANYMGIQGIGKMVLAQAGGNRWRYSLDIGGSMANLNQTTVFEDSNGAWRPISNSDSSELLIRRKQKKATYDWSRGEARWSGDVKPERAGPVKLQSGDLDAMLINLAIARDVAAGKPLRYRMVDDGRVKQLNYQVSGKETITVGGKPRQATKVIRVDGDKQEMLWVVDGVPVPARILRRKDGQDEMDLRLQTVH
ncbi:DUF3108 domain-containing protein [Lysobacter solisilvae (ex Woo and Kim 2020)]|uniref:DUF3108 domain-containing protein n=1 Tax=Agrilutibacter terrestris TaxID=2865112 RepID=A0A7H0FYQ3_9GAMM|nr:DUF3108 domain-containing protein [Lysobacter terrestris]QNP41169.1 DUF3108 domain-containing protein [Lysobacter terrestris]